MTGGFDRNGRGAAFTLKEHGIYLTRDGRVVGPAHHRGLSRLNYDVAFPWVVGIPGDKDRDLYLDDGSYTYTNYSPDDLVAEVVVGEGWLPWNGGEEPPSGQVVGMVLRVGTVLRSDACFPDAALCVGVGLRWSNTGLDGDIVAYRLASPESKKDASYYTAPLKRLGEWVIWEGDNDEPPAAIGGLVMLRDGWIKRESDCRDDKYWNWRGGKPPAFPPENIVAYLPSDFAKPQIAHWNLVEAAVAKADKPVQSPLSIRPHTIYLKRNGLPEGPFDDITPSVLHPTVGMRLWLSVSSGCVWRDNGIAHWYLDRNADAEEVVAVVASGEGWRAWGPSDAKLGFAPVTGSVEIALSGFDGQAQQNRADKLKWLWNGSTPRSGDIIAYRPLEAQK